MATVNEYNFRGAQEFHGFTEGGTQRMTSNDLNRDHDDLHTEPKNWWNHNYPDCSEAAYETQGALDEDPFSYTLQQSANEYETTEVKDTTSNSNFIWCARTNWQNGYPNSPSPVDLGAKVRERRRMISINSAFEALRKRLPTFPYERRLSKIDTLRLAIAYMALLNDMLANMDCSTNDQSGCGVVSFILNRLRSPTRRFLSWYTSVTAEETHVIKEGFTKYGEEGVECRTVVWNIKIFYEILYMAQSQMFRIFMIASYWYYIPDIAVYFHKRKLLTGLLKTPRQPTTSFTLRDLQMCVVFENGPIWVQVKHKFDGNSGTSPI
ncbi:pancreas transcription factor 1 subunit alpha [Clonorchis sinensis]|uniref:Pancreas transcription factor 1 subunit alpha n=1 Tax=Clonorchis sinensis TaxID=79923 RepID=G7YTG3_CLOSI|nr:pancreas transcription factor 1 subunit alpha [Clonorchis sinensis]